MERVPVFEPELTEDDAQAALAAVRSGWVSSAGPALEAFEAAWAKRTRMPHAVAVSSGTAALELAVAALGIGPGDEVICPTFTIVSCVRAIVLAGATPVLVDAEPRTFNLDVDALEARIGPKTKALLLVHTYGHPVDPRVLAIAREKGLLVIEDAAEAHGAEVEIDGALRECGGLGDVSVLSFYANKPVTTGEGGMVLAREGIVAEKLRSLRNLAFGRGHARFSHEALGGNFRLTNVQAAIGLAQLARLDATIEAKRRVARAYRARLQGVVRLQVHEAWARPIDWMVGVVVDRDAASFAERLAARGVETRPFFLGMHEQPVFRARGLFASERHPVSEHLSRHGVYLPSSTRLDEATVDRVAAAVREAR